MDIGRAFTFVFEDEQWITKALIAAAILLLGVAFSWLLAIPLILAFALLSGYMMEIIRDVLRGELDQLPEWANWGELIVDGIKVVVIGIIYGLPIIIATICLGMPMALFAEDAEAFSSLLGLLLSCFTLLYAIAMSIVLPAAYAVYAATDDLGAAFRFGDVFGLVGDNLSTYLITFVMSWVAGLIGSLGSFVCGIGWLVTLPYAIMVYGHLYGQAYVASGGQRAQLVAEEDFS
jgi:hypothetical protein